MANPLVLGIKDDIQGNLNELVGGKCAQLARMSNLAFAVPDWICFTTAVFQRFLAENQISIPSELPAPREAAVLRERILNSSFSSGLRDLLAFEVKSILARSSSGALAIRSSATVEDSGRAAFAGQFDTFLGVIEIDAALESIKRCWSSLWSERGLKYSGAMVHYGHPAMAVIAQELVPADVSGVLFTVNPVTQRQTEIVIEATLGLGSLLVGGQVVPDQFVVETQDGANVIKSKRIGSKRKIHRWNVSLKQIEEIATPPDLRGNLSLDEASILNLANLGLALQSLFGCPQDVEWAIHQTQSYIVQSRPITTMQ